MSQQRKSTSMETRRSAILYFWNNGQRAPASISIEHRAHKDRPCNMTASDSGALGQ